MRIEPLEFERLALFKTNLSDIKILIQSKFEFLFMAVLSSTANFQSYLMIPTKKGITMFLYLQKENLVNRWCIL